MKLLFTTFLQIMLLRSGPQVLPASRHLLGLSLLLHWLTGVALGLFGQPLRLSVFSALAATLLMVALVHFILMLQRHRPRFTQTLTALAGCEVILGLIALPISTLYYAGDWARDIAALLLLAVLGWNVVLAAHIFRHALDITQGRGLIYAICYMLISIWLASQLGA